MNFVELLSGSLETFVPEESHEPTENIANNEGYDD